MFRHRAARPVTGALPLAGTSDVARPRGAVRMSWLEAARASASLAFEQSGLIALGLAGFLARGGLLLFVLPFVALPTIIGVGNWIGPTSITASGPSERLLWLVGSMVAAAVVAIGIGTVIGSLADIALYRAAAGRAAAGRAAAGRVAARRAEEPDDAVDRFASGALVSRVVLIRVLAMVPLGLALAWSANRFGEAAYHELILPEELVTPLVVRVLDQTRDAVAVVILAWLAGELLGGLAARHHLQRGGSVPMALLRPFADIVRRPITTAAAFGLGLVLLIVVLVPLITFASLLFGGLRSAIAREDVLRMFAAAVLFVTAWAAALGAAGLIATWRSLLASFEVLRTAPVEAQEDASAPVGAGQPVLAARPDA